MKKLFNFILDGYVRLLFPLVVCFMVIEKVLHVLNPLIHQIKDKLHIQRLVGVFDIFLISLVVLLLVGLLAGLLLKSAYVSKKIKAIESSILRKIPVYNELKSLFDKNQTKKPDPDNYLPALLKEEERYALGYITDQSENYYTIVICDTSIHGGELRVVPKESVKLLDISYFDFSQRIKMYGSNLAHFAEEL